MAKAKGATPEVSALRARLRELADPKQIAILQRFFKTGPGEYGEGDVFIGVKVPRIRALVREHKGFELASAEALLASSVHEERMLALLLLVHRFERSEDAALRRRIYELYLASTAHIDNWDLVDSSAAQIVGGYLQDRDRAPLYALARSGSLWDRRIAMIAAFRFIRRNDFDDALRIAAVLIGDREDLIHKAVGWMLREVGQRDREAEEAFLKKRYKGMPRTMLRYAIEKFEEPKRQAYLKGTI
ncbi:MAG: DNA alkylation repair protein [Proteobacteria bacterium]|jgi:3-methyladenine DNA glycosylase AlkD|nr:DNA alkylation repair protein [Pseudomonadota bacterium]